MGSPRPNRPVDPDATLADQPLDAVNPEAGSQPHPAPASPENADESGDFEINAGATSAGDPGSTSGARPPAPKPPASSPGDGDPYGATLFQAATIDARGGASNPAETLDASGSSRSNELRRALKPGTSHDFEGPIADGKASAIAFQWPAVTGYEILDELGRGGMGVVYKARQVRLNRLVALKMLLAGAHAGTEQMQRFQVEAEAVAHLTHPNIVQIYEVGEQDGMPFFSLEFVPGGSLQQKLEGRPLSDQMAAQLVAILARAMSFAHEQGVVHRDLKPGNILLAADGTPKISDFGLAKRLDVDGDQSQTRSGTLMGSPSYMAPEQAMGDIHHIGPLTDVYALGALLYELISGRPPFLSPKLLDTLEMVRSQDPVPPSRLQPGVSRDLETICLKCLQKEPRRRYESAQLLAEDLDRFLAGRPILARPITTPERAWRWCRRNPGLATLGAAVLGLLVLVAAGSTAASIQIAAKQRETERQRVLAVNAQKETERQRQAAVASQKVAEQKTAEALEARSRADASAKIAIEQSQLAANTLYKVITEFDDQLKNKPGLQSLREKLLASALKDLGQIYQASGTTMEPRARIAALQRTGDLYLKIGQTTEALAQYQAALAVCEEFARTTKTPDIALFNEAVLYDKLANVGFRMTANSRIPREYLEKARDKRQQLVSFETFTPPLNAKRVRDALAGSHAKLGDLAFQSGDPRAAAAAFDAYFQVRGGFEAKTPQVLFERLQAVPADQRDELYPANFMIRIGELAQRLDDPATAERIFTEALERSRVAAAAASQKGDVVPVDIRRNEASALDALGDLALQKGNASEARELYEQAHAIDGQIAQEDGRSAESLTALATSFYRLATAAHRLGEAEPARTLYQKALELRRQLATDDPSSTFKQIDRMLTEARCGNSSEALELASQLTQRAEGDPGVLFFIACAHAILGSGTPAGPDRDAQLQQATTILRQATDAGFKDAVALRSDPDLEALSAFPPFQALLAAVAKP